MDKNRKSIATYWLEAAKKDLPVIDHLFEKGDYPWALFVAHLVLEKVLKAYYVKKVSKVAPYTHSLSLLAEESNLKLSFEHKELLEKVTDFNLEVRYPEEKFNFYTICTREFTQHYLKRIKEFYQWLLEKI